MADVELTGGGVGDDDVDIVGDVAGETFGDISLKEIMQIKECLMCQHLFSFVGC